jgi:excisionase family DNA binding protein
MKIAEPRDHGEPRPLEQRLLSPERAAAYLGLRSRFAVYRLVASGQLPALRLANKLRVDLRDLESMIENAKVGATLRPVNPGSPRVSRPVPRQLGPPCVRHQPVTVPVTAPPGSA